MRNRLVNFIVFLFFGLCVLSVSSSQGHAAAGDEAKTEKDKSRVWGVSGEVSGIDKDSISIVYSKDVDKGTEKEILIPIDRTTKVERISDLESIRIGDIVEVRYEELEERRDGHPRKKRIARVVSFVKAVAAKPVTSVIGASEDGASEEDAEEASSDKSYEEVYD